MRYSTSRFSSARAFSISGTVREQYISFRFVGWNLNKDEKRCRYRREQRQTRTCWYETINDRRDTVFPVPEGISSTQWPYNSDPE